MKVADWPAVSWEKYFSEHLDRIACIADTRRTEADIEVWSALV
ncbi:hypothetical protein [Undibacterium fentianense]|nr:hypothetical protein [Undibacterium fentianense]